jgi:hypothetical protein
MSINDGNYGGLMQHTKTRLPDKIPETSSDKFHSDVALPLREEASRTARPERAPKFSHQELQALHGWCLTYRDLVRGGGRPSKEQDERFMLFSRVCYGEGVACV